MSEQNRIRVIPMAAAAFVLATALASGCGPTKPVVTTPSPTAANSKDQTRNINSSVVLPDESLPPLPGVMAGECAQPSETPSAAATNSK